MTETPGTILVAVDFSEASGRAIRLAEAVATRCDASLHLLHAGTADLPPYLTPDEVEMINATGREARVLQFLKEFGRRYTDSNFGSHVDEGAPADVILRESAHVDLVIMGTHGRRGPSRWWLGSVAERVLREVACPLLIVRADGSGPAPDTFRRILVSASAPLTGVPAIDYAEMLASRFNGAVVDARYEPLEPALERASATAVVVAMPAEREDRWLPNIGKPIVRFFTCPILFVPEPDAA